MFYVLQIAPHEESQIEKILRATMPETLCRQCFHPMRQMRKKIHGEWTTKTEKLLPGNVFVETDAPKEFYRELVKIPRLTKMLGKVYNEIAIDWEFEALSPEEVVWLTNVMSCGENGEIPLSQVRRDKNGEILILSGPLMYLKNSIRKVDLHRRIAKVELSFRQKKSVLHFGIEIEDMLASKISRGEIILSEMEKTVDQFIAAALQAEKYQGINFLQDTRVYLYNAIGPLQNKMAKAVSEQAYVENVKDNLIWFMNRSALIVQTIRQWLETSVPTSQQASDNYDNNIMPRVRTLTLSKSFIPNIDALNSCIRSTADIAVLDKFPMSKRIDTVESLYADLRLADSVLIEVMMLMPSNPQQVSVLKRYSSSSIANQMINRIKFIVDDCRRSYPVLFKK